MIRVLTGLLLLLGIVMVGSAGSLPDYQVDQRITPTPTPRVREVYAAQRVNTRSCAATSCEVVAQVEAGTSLRVRGVVEGEAVQAGNAVWYEVRVGTQRAYVYSGVVQTQRPVTAVPGSGLRSTPQPTAMAVSTASTGLPAFECRGDVYNCSDMRTCQRAREYLAACPGDQSMLDRDRDGIPCETLCN